MEMIDLKNGTSEPDPIVRVVLLSLRSLCETSPMVFYDLVMVCRNATYKAWSNMGPAKDAGLMDADGNVHQSIRNVILSAVSGDGLAMTIASPAKCEAESR